MLMGAASTAGIFLPFVYAKETPSWAAQGIGQDVVNLCLILPAMLICLYRAAEGSIRAVLVCLGLLIYMIYSYVLYAFFVHFSALFPVYIAVLGLSFYAFAGVLSDVRHEQARDMFEHTTGRAQSAYLMLSGVGFGALWLSSIAAAIASGEPPRDVVETGFPVNPVHVLDLAFVLPAMIVTSVSLWKRRALGFLLAVPLMTFAAAMGSAIVGMMLVMRTRGLPAPGGLIAAMTIATAIALYLTLKVFRTADNPAPAVNVRTFG